MKYKVIYVLRKLLGLKTYLFLFALITIKRFRTLSYVDDFPHFISLIPEEGIVLDIGANIGLNAIPIAQQRPGVKVFCFEPVPLNISVLERVIRFFNLTNTKIFKTALGETNGELKMIIPIVGGVVMTGLSHSYIGESPQVETQGDIISTKMLRLDDIPEIQSAEKITAIKIDVENFEYFVLKGGAATISKHMPIIHCELWDNENRTMAMDFLKSLGYKVMIFDDVKLVEFRDEELYVNFFFIPSAPSEITKI
jgi:FkbM family methyltransferase